MHWIVRGMTPVALVCIVAAFTSKRHEVAVDGRQVLRAEVGSACAGYCVECQGGGGGHAATTGGHTCEDGNCTGQNANEGGGWHLACEGADDCASHHCNQQFASAEASVLTEAELLRRVSDALLRDDGRSLADLLEANPERMEFNERRRSVQLYACDGEVVAHLPVTDRVFRRLLD